MFRMFIIETFAMAVMRFQCSIITSHDTVLATARSVNLQQTAHLTRGQVGMPHLTRQTKYFASIFQPPSSGKHSKLCWRNIRVFRIDRNWCSSVVFRKTTRENIPNCSKVLNEPSISDLGPWTVIWIILAISNSITYRSKIHAEITDAILWSKMMFLKYIFYRKITK